jgi:hypothetical protein
MVCTKFDTRNRNVVTDRKGYYDKTIKYVTKLNKEHAFEKKKNRDAVQREPQVLEGVKSFLLKPFSRGYFTWYLPGSRFRLRRSPRALVQRTSTKYVHVHGGAGLFSGNNGFRWRIKSE